MRAFTVQVEETALAELQQRLAATRWLDDPTGGAPGYGAELAFVRALCAHWAEHFDWRAVEARLNAQPQVIAEIDGIAIHAIHRRSSRPDAVPLLLLHGWPSSVLEFLDLCEPLAEPAADDAPAFHVIAPSLPGYGWSTTRSGVSPRRIAAQMAELMTRLGYDRFLIQGGNWGSGIGTEIAREWPERVIGLHLNSVNGSAPPVEAGVVLSPADQALADIYAGLLRAPHFNLVAQAPLSVAHAMNDSPAGLLAWLGERLRDWADLALPGNPGLAPDWIVATTALYWFTGTAASSQMLYREAVHDPVPERFVTVPTGVAHFAAELVMIPRPWAERHYNLVRWSEIAQGGHYPAIEVPELFLEDVRSFAQMLCAPEKTG
ncbi:epoxide hydrolase family protein [Novosphingobium sp. JCM 18896]|uniref:epoxide hydrolase family protein n=1 Tax=Novosphingobium sp. JCM 18896 TaxID=2989731 RepID=UPI0022228E81|nr:epoxide hydrolase family protein [Novosphingobium sp. JCM 18896]MCW1429948.1 epoxide hydrolase [Novosphingobium sp. JCM 18896]